MKEVCEFCGIRRKGKLHKNKSGTKTMYICNQCEPNLEKKLQITALNRKYVAHL